MEDPLKRKKEKLYLRHDEMRIKQVRPGEMVVEYFWRGVATCKMSFDCDFASGQELKVTGVEGRTEIKASPF